MSSADSSPLHPLASALPWPCCASQTGSSVSEAGPESGPSPRLGRAAPRTPRRARRSPPAASRTCGVALSLSAQTRWCCTTRRAPTRTAVSAVKRKEAGHARGRCRAGRYRRRSCPAASGRRRRRAGTTPSPCTGFVHRRYAMDCKHVCHVKQTARVARTYLRSAECMTLAARSCARSCRVSVIGARVL
jgi:hypothetical protein